MIRVFVAIDVAIGWAMRSGSRCSRKRIPTIARRRFFRPNENFDRGPRVNDRIRVSPIRLIDENEEMVGVIETLEALARARDVGLDLVEVSPTSTPPVCRIMDFGKYKYEQSKKDKAAKAKTKGGELKEVRLGRSLKIDPHDIRIRIEQAKRFLLEGHKVQIVQNFHGREMIHRERGFKRMNDIIEELTELGKLEMAPRMAGRRMTVIIGPDKVKIEQFKRKQAKDKGEEAASKPPEKDADESTDASGSDGEDSTVSSRSDSSS